MNKNLEICVVIIFITSLTVDSENNKTLFFNYSTKKPDFINVSINNSCYRKITTSDKIVFNDYEANSDILFINPSPGFKRKIVDMNKDDSCNIEELSPTPQQEIYNYKVKSKNTNFNNINTSVVRVFLDNSTWDDEIQINNRKLNDFKIETRNKYELKDSVYFWIKGDFFLPKTIKGYIEVDESNNQNIVLEPATFKEISPIIIETDPKDVILKLNEKILKNNKYLPKDCSPCTFTLSKIGYEDTTITVTPSDKNRKIKVNLKKEVIVKETEPPKFVEKCSLNLISDKNINISIYAAEKDSLIHSIRTPKTVDIPYGTYIFKCFKKRFRDSTITKQLDSKYDTLQIDLKPKKYNLTIETIPSEANLVINNAVGTFRRKEKTDCNMKLIEGEYELEISKCLYRKENRNVNIPSDTVKTIRLKKKKIHLLTPSNKRVFKKGEEVCFRWRDINCGEFDAIYKFYISSDSTFSFQDQVYFLTDNDTCFSGEYFNEGEYFWKVDCIVDNDSIVANKSNSFNIVKQKSINYVIDKRFSLNYHNKLKHDSDLSDIKNKTPFSSYFEVGKPNVIVIDFLPTRKIRFSLGSYLYFSSKNVFNFGIKQSPKLGFFLISNKSLQLDLYASSAFVFAGSGIAEKSITYYEPEIGFNVNINDRSYYFTISKIWHKSFYKNMEHVSKIYTDSGIRISPEAFVSPLNSWIQFNYIAFEKFKEFSIGLSTNF